MKSLKTFARLAGFAALLAVAPSIVSPNGTSPSIVAPSGRVAGTSPSIIAPSITSPSIVSPNTEVAVSWNSITSPSIVTPSAEQVAATSPSATGGLDVSWNS